VSKTNQHWLPIFQKFISFMRIQSKEASSLDERGVKLELWDSQRMFLEQLCDGLDTGQRIFYVLKSRQLGVSTISLAVDVFWLAMHPGTIGALVTESDTNREIFRNTIRKYIESFPQGFFGSKFSIVKDNRNYISFSNGSRLDFLVAGTRKKENWGEGRGYSYVHATECGKYGSARGWNSFKESWATSHPDRLFIMESTANGINYWKSEWEEAERDVHTKRRIFLGWWSKPLNSLKKNDPRYPQYGTELPSTEEQELIDIVKEKYGFKVKQEQLAWYRYKKSELSSTAQDLDQNNPWFDQQAFVLTGFSFFPVRSLRTDYEAAQDMQFKAYRFWMGNEFHAVKMEQIVDSARLSEVTLRVWEEPVRDAVYSIGCDPAWGRTDHNDRSSISVWRCYADRFVQVAEYADSMDETFQVAWIFAFLCGVYRNNVHNVEITGGPGLAIMREIDNLRVQMNTEMYERVVNDYQWDDFLANAKWYIYTKADGFGGGGGVKGWKSSLDSKNYMCNAFRDSYNTKLLTLRSINLIGEMGVVVQEGNRIGAPEPEKDDRVFAAMLAHLSWVERIRTKLVNEGYAYELITAQENGEVSRGSAIVDRIVQNFFKNAAEMAEEEPDTRDNFLVERGLA
jgi:hypothetical protein